MSVFDMPKSNLPVEIPETIRTGQGLYEYILTTADGPQQGTWVTVNMKHRDAPLSAIYTVRRGSEESYEIFDSILEAIRRNRADILAVTLADGMQPTA